MRKYFCVATTPLRAVQVLEKAAAHPESDNYENKNEQSNLKRRTRTTEGIVDPGVHIRKAPRLDFSRLRAEPAPNTVAPPNYSIRREGSLSMAAELAKRTTAHRAHQLSIFWEPKR